MIWRMALRVANDNRRLRAEIRDLKYLLVHAQQECERLHVSIRTLRRDADLLGLMARDRDVALGVLRDMHRIDGI